MRQHQPFAGGNQSAGGEDEEQAGQRQRGETAGEAQVILHQQKQQEAGGEQDQGQQFQCQQAGEEAGDQPGAPAPGAAG